MKKMICFLLCLFFTVPAYAETLDTQIEAKAVILTEAQSGRVLYEENADERLPIASVTKIMTMLLIAEALDEGRISPNDMVKVSQNAMDMGGSTMFLETGEELSVNDMLKGIAVASANDGCVAMAEFLDGSVSAFVNRMNSRAAELKMTNTNFVNTNGLDDENHFSSARDVALMSAELLKHERVFEYTTIWTDSLRDGKFALANTNKLVRFYEGANGLKTGSTSKAGCCLSATAKRNDLQLIAVVLGAPSSKERFSGAKALLDYGFYTYKMQKPIKKGDLLGTVKVDGGVVSDLSGAAKNDVSLLLLSSDAENAEIVTEFETVKAPVYVNEKIGTASVIKNGETVGKTDITATETVEKKSLTAWFLEFLRGLCI